MRNTNATHAHSADSPAPVEGLCATCVHPPGCMYVHAATAPIWRCEEFDDDVPIATSMLAAVTPATDGIEAHSSDAALAATGLCANCDERAVCAHLRRAGSVWHCEEYR